MALSSISTITVDNIVDKHVLTSQKPCIDAGFNKMHIPKAKIKVNRINDLQSIV
jgi:hypothetical protein